MKPGEKTSFLVRNLLRGFLWLALLVGVFIYAKQNLDSQSIGWMQPLNDYPTVVYLIFTLSEIVIGLIPPEVFMIWGTRHGDLTLYIYTVFLLSIISYSAGVAGYWIGVYLYHTRYYRLMRKRVFGKYEKYFVKFGTFLVIVASLTPLPFSGIAMLVGSSRYSFKKYLAYSSFRFLRFVIYSFLIWEAYIL